MGKKRTFVINSASLSANGYHIEPQGIDTSRFEVNPVMLYEHRRDARFPDAIGTWENIRFAEGKWYADAVLQESTENPDLIELKKKVEQGIIKACSIGIIAYEIKKGKNGEADVITKSELFEVSLVNIPANRDATLVQMSFHESCSFLPQPQPNKSMSKLSEFFKGLVGLDESSDPQAVVKAHEQYAALEKDFSEKSSLVESLQTEKKRLEGQIEQDKAEITELRAALAEKANEIQGKDTLLSQYSGRTFKKTDDATASTSNGLMEGFIDLNAEHNQYLKKFIGQ